MVSGTSAHPTPELQTVSCSTGWDRKGKTDRKSYTGNAGVPPQRSAGPARTQVSKAVSAPGTPLGGSNRHATECTLLSMHEEQHPGGR